MIVVIFQVNNQGKIEFYWLYDLDIDDDIFLNNIIRLYECVIIYIHFSTVMKYYQYYQCDLNKHSF